MKYYFIKCPRHFGNEFDLCWVDSDNKEAIDEIKRKGWERISRKKAFFYVRNEKYSRNYDPSCIFSGATEIFPYYILIGDYENAAEGDGWISFYHYLSNGKRVRKILKTKDGVIYE